MIQLLQQMGQLKDPQELLEVLEVREVLEVLFRKQGLQEVPPPVREETLGKPSHHPSIVRRLHKSSSSRQSFFSKLLLQQSRQH